MLSLWIFAREPDADPPNRLIVPVICPQEAAMRINLADCEDGRERRVIREHIVAPVELRGWRFVSSSVFPNPTCKGLFPWEIAARTEGQQDG
jgi:hypothetical protein